MPSPIALTEQQLLTHCSAFQARDCGALRSDAFTVYLRDTAAMYDVSASHLRSTVCAWVNWGCEEPPRRCRMILDDRYVKPHTLANWIDLVAEYLAERGI